MCREELLFDCNGCGEVNFLDKELFDCEICKESYCEECFNKDLNLCLMCNNTESR